jgi:hypothetical protein
VSIGVERGPACEAGQLGGGSIQPVLGGLVIATPSKQTEDKSEVGVGETEAAVATQKVVEVPEMLRPLSHPPEDFMIYAATRESAPQ